MSEIVDIAADGVADGLHVVSEEALALEKTTRSFDRMSLAYLGLGLAAGAAAGAFVGFKVAYKKAELKYQEIAQEEIEGAREHYRAKERALDNVQGKPELEDIIRDRGYSTDTQPPMAVTPPEAVVEAAAEIAETGSSDPRPPVPVEPREQNVFQQKPPNPEELGEPEPQVVDEWDIEAERARRSSRRAYVIHRTEVAEEEDYDTMTYTYYEEDDVLCNEEDEVIPKDERDDMIGEANLNKFGHGSDDPSIVYIRNDKREIQFEVIRSPNSYAEEVHGFTPTDELRHQNRRERRSRHDE